MIYSNALVLFLLVHDQNKVCNRNFCLIQYVMHSYETAGTKFKRVCADFPNLLLLAKRTSAGKNIRLPVMKVLLCVAAGELEQSKKLQDWASLRSDLNLVYN